MATPELERQTTGAKTAVAEARHDGLNAKVEQQVSAILEQAERQATTQAAPTLAYRIPCAGVRYYSF